MIRFISQILEIGILPRDAQELRLQKRFLVFLALFMSIGGLLWGGICLVFRLNIQGAIPFSYVLITICNLLFFYKSKNFMVVQTIQTLASLLLPFLFQWSLGGFAPSGVMMFWAVLAILASITYQSTLNSFIWVGLFIVLTIISGIYDDFFFQMKPTILANYSLPFLVCNLIVISSIIACLVIYLVNRQNKSQKILIEKQHNITLKNQLLNETNQKLSDTMQIMQKQNDNIISSIHYALRIQNAILPPEIDLQKYLDCFVFFRPRDIVSGDFYWFTEKGNLQILVVGDCTGHGVSGAFMTMIGNNLLNQIIHDQEIHQPDAILNQVQQLLYKVFAVTDKEIADGMDIAVVTLAHKSCSIIQNTPSFTLQYSGAKIPLYWVAINLQNDEVDIHTIKADRIPIEGRRVQDHNYTLHTLICGHDEETVNSTTILLPEISSFMFYLCSDGYQDQLGGTQHRQKFLSANLRKTFTSVANQPTKDQKQVLVETFDDWKADNRQIDDVLVLGVKVC